MGCLCIVQCGAVEDLPVPWEDGWEMLKLCLVSGVRAAVLLDVTPACSTLCICYFLLAKEVLEPCLPSLGCF